MLSYRATFDALRSATTSGISTGYAPIGNASSYLIVAVKFLNVTNGDVVVSLDGTTDMLYIPSNSFTLYDLRTNASYETDYALPVGTVFFVKDGSVVGSNGTFYIETLIAKQIIGS